MYTRANSILIHEFRKLFPGANVISAYYDGERATVEVDGVTYGDDQQDDTFRFCCAPGQCVSFPEPADWQDAISR